MIDPIQQALVKEAALVKAKLECFDELVLLHAHRMEKVLGHNRFAVTCNCKPCGILKHARSLQAGEL